MAALELDDLTKTFYLYSSILVLKMMLMSVLTARQRFQHKAFANPEDGQRLKVKPRVDENVERVRRAHLNDIENIPLFLFVGYIYLHTNPAVAWATLLFRVFTAARILHTLVYAIFVVPQPARALSWGTGFFVTGYMAVKSVLYFLLG